MTQPPSRAPTAGSLAPSSPGDSKPATADSAPFSSHGGSGSGSGSGSAGWGALGVGAGAGIDGGGRMGGRGGRGGRGGGRLAQSIRSAAAAAVGTAPGLGPGVDRDGEELKPLSAMKIIGARAPQVTDAAVVLRKLHDKVPRILPRCLTIVGVASPRHRGSLFSLYPSLLTLSSPLFVVPLARPSAHGVRVFLRGRCTRWPKACSSPPRRCGRRTTRTTAWSAWRPAAPSCKPRRKKVLVCAAFIPPLLGWPAAVLCSLGRRLAPLRCHFFATYLSPGCV